MVIAGFAIAIVIILWRMLDAPPHFSTLPASRDAMKMQENILGVCKDASSFLCSYIFAFNLFPLDSHIITGLFGLGGVVLGRVLDWGYERWKKRRARRRPLTRKKPVVKSPQ